MGRTILRGVKLNEVSLVGKGDNPEAHILLLKNHPNVILSKSEKYRGADKAKLLKEWYEEKISKGLIEKEDDEAVLFDELQGNKELRDKIWSMVWMLEESMSSILCDDTVSDKKAMITQSIDQFKTAVSEIAKGGSEMPEELKKAQEALEAAQAKVEDLTKQLEVVKAKPAPGEKCPTCGMTMPMKKEAEEIDKSALPESVRKHLEEVEKENKANREAIEKMQDENLTQTCITKAATVPAVGSAEEVGSLLKEISKKDSTLADKVFDVLKVADERIKKGGLFKELGGNGDTNETTAIDKINALAKEYQKENGVTFEKAFDHVYSTNSELRKAYQSERSR